MSKSLMDFCDATSGLDDALTIQRFQKVQGLLESDDDIIFLIGFIPNFHRSLRKSAWKACQKKFKEIENQPGIIEKAFGMQSSFEKRKDFLYFMSSYGDSKCLLGDSIICWLVAETSKSLESLKRVQDLAILTKILNSTVKLLSEKQLVQVTDLILSIRNALKEEKLHLHVELCASFAVTVVNFGIAKDLSPDDFFGTLQIKSIENIAYKLFIIRALVSSLPESSLTLSFGSWRLSDYLIVSLVDISLSTKLEPTQICYAVRGLTESVEFFQRRKIILSKEVYSIIDRSGLLTKMSEHPLDVVRVNSWKLIRILAAHKLEDLDSNKESLRADVTSLVRGGFSARSDTIWLTSFLEPKVIPIIEDLIDFEKIIIQSLNNGREQSLAPLSGILLAKCYLVKPEQTMDEIMRFFPTICEDFEPNSRRLFFEVVLPKMLSQNKKITEAFLEICKNSKNHDITQLMICILKLQKTSFSDGLISTDDLIDLLSSKSIDSRLNTLGYITTSRKTAAVFSETSLQLIQLSISNNLNLQRPAHRQLLNSILVKVFSRFDASFNSTNDNSPSYLNLISFIIKTCSNELVPGSAMSRNAIILNYLQYMLSFDNKSLKSHVESCFNENIFVLVTRLKSLLFNSFTEISSKSLEILILAYNLCGKGFPRSVTETIKLLRESGNLTNSSGLVNLLNFELQSKSIEDKIPLAKLAGNFTRDICEILYEDLENADIIYCATTKSHYGLLAGLEMLLPYMKDSPEEMKTILLEDFLKVCNMANDFAVPVVNASSPEGFLPEIGISNDLENLKLDGRRIATNSTELAQLLLVMCWRMTKSVSLLLGSMCATLSAPLRCYEKCGEYFMTQLTRGRHRGAFELAASGFTQLCKDVRRVKDLSFSGLLDKWLARALNILHDDEKIQGLCNTRRSAGVPYMFVAICSADVGARGKPLLTRTMANLFPLAEDTSDQEVACHARNILRALFRESNFGEDVLQFAEKSMIMSISGFADKSWALRNTSAMLYSTLSSRIFGVKKTDDEQTISSSEFMSRFPLLQQALLEILENSAQKVESTSLPPNLLPSLLIIQRLIPTSTGSAEARFIPSLIQLSGSKVWKCRQVAARCFAALNTRPLTTYESEFNSIIDSKDQNRIHGLLLLLASDESSLKTIPSSVQIRLIQVAESVSMACQSMFIKLANLTGDDNLASKAELIICSNSGQRNLAEFEFYEESSKFAKSSLKVTSHLLRLRGNAARALVVEGFKICDQTRQMTIDILLKSKCDESRIGAAQLLLRDNDLTQEQISSLSVLGAKLNMDHVENPELIGIILELLVKFGKTDVLATLVGPASKPHQHWLLRRSASICCVSIANTNYPSAEALEALLRLWVDEDSDVKEPIINQFGDIPFVGGRSPIMDFWITKISSHEALEVLLKIGFHNESETFSLFQERATAFELVNLNMNFEPILMTRLALYGLKKLTMTDNMDELRTISARLTTLLKEIGSNRSQTEVGKLQFNLLSDFIANI